MSKPCVHALADYFGQDTSVMTRGVSVCIYRLKAVIQIKYLLLGPFKLQAELEIKKRKDFLDTTQENHK